jgi:hypothetical protein
MALSSEQILALAPDPASAKAGSQLAAPAKWQACGANERAVWGECQGSGKDPYRTQVDLSEPAFKCTCPSRKFPCKHGLGLLLLHAAKPAHFVAGEPPAWVGDWLASRQKRSEKAEAAAVAEAAPLTPEQLAAKATASARREEKRESRVAAGLEELQKWLEDLAHEGYASLRSRGLKPWQDLAARLVDAQAPGLAGRLRRASSWPFVANLPDWENHLTRELANLYLLAHSLRSETPLLDADDAKAAIGVAIRQEDVLAGSMVADRWQVLGQRQSEEERVRLRATWLYGTRSLRYALVLHFAVGTQGYGQTIVPGTEFDAELAFYPGALPQRALIKSMNAAGASARPLPEMPDVWRDYAAALAAQPFVERHPLTLAAAPLPRGERWALRLPSGALLAAHPHFQQGWQLLALSGGAPLQLFGEWDGDSFLPWSAQVAGRVINLEDLPREAA